MVNPETRAIMISKPVKGLIILDSWQISVSSERSMTKKRKTIPPTGKRPFSRPVRVCKANAHTTRVGRTTREGWQMREGSILYKAATRKTFRVYAARASKHAINFNGVSRFKTTRDIRKENKERPRWCTIFLKWMKKTSHTRDETSDEYAGCYALAGITNRICSS